MNKDWFMNGLKKNMILPHKNNFLFKKISLKFLREQIL